MTDSKLKVSVIRDVQVNERTYLLKEDVIDLLQQASKCAQSLSAMTDIGNLARALIYGGHD